MGNKNSATSPMPIISPRTLSSHYNRTRRSRFSRMKRKGNNDVPLKSVSVNAKIRFEFTLSSDEATVCGLSVQVGDKIILGKVQEKQKAFDNYDNSIASGHSAFLLESKSAGTYALSVGAIAPDQEVEVTLTLISELINYDHDPSCLLFLLPNTMFPIHTYPLEIAVSIHLTNGIKNIYCNVSDAIIKSEPSTVFVKSPEFNFFYLVLQLENPYVPSAIVEKFENTTAFMLNFYPTWKNVDEDHIITNSELIFVVDRSGSMSGPRINAAKSTLQFFLRSLPEGVMFNIVGFGSRQQWLFDESKPYTEANLQAASKYVDSMEANLGGTVLLAPLKSIFAKPYRDEYPRQLFVITDGSVNNIEEVIEEARRASHNTRIFTLGIGESTSQKLLVEGLAKAGRGASELIRSTTEDSMETKVIAQLKRAIEPCLRKVKVNWGNLNVQQSPTQIRPVFNGERLIVYGIAQNIENQEDIIVQLEGIGPEDNVLTFDININLKQAQQGNIIHKLAARKIIRDLEDGKPNFANTQTEIVRLGVKYQLATRETSYVAVLETNKNAEDILVRTTIPSVSTDKSSHNRRPNYDYADQEVSMALCNAMAPMELSKSYESEGIEDDELAARLARLKSSSPTLPNKSSTDVTNDATKSFIEPIQNIPTKPCSITEREESILVEILPPRTGPLKMSDIVKLQRANGSWGILHIEWLTGVSAEKLKSGLTVKSEEPTLLEYCWATCLAIIMIEEQYSTTKNDWILIEQKALKFINRSLKQMKIGQDLLQDAKEFIKLNLMVLQ